jgi:anti-sigma regulatory factor (Ser/Thr protein kinase)
VIAAPFGKALPDPPEQAAALEWGRGDLAAIRGVVRAHATEAGLAANRAAEVVLAANEIATNSVLHGGGGGAIRLWRTAASLALEVRDRGSITDPLAGRTRPAVPGEGGRGLWLANQLCDLVQIRSIPTGSLVRLHVHTG